MFTEGGRRMKWMMKAILWLARNEVQKIGWAQYDRGWEDGVEQQRRDPESTSHYVSFDAEGEEVE